MNKLLLLCTLLCASYFTMGYADTTTCSAGSSPCETLQCPSNSQKVTLMPANPQIGVVTKACCTCGAGVTVNSNAGATITTNSTTTTNPTGVTNNSGKMINNPGTTNLTPSK